MARNWEATARSSLVPVRAEAERRPVSYRLIDGSIVFRIAPGSKMSAAADGAVVAFEVDDYQLADRSGWSVLAVGRAELIHAVAMTFKVLDAGALECGWGGWHRGLRELSGGSGSAAEASLRRRVASMVRSGHDQTGFKQFVDLAARCGGHRISFVRLIGRR